MMDNFKQFIRDIDSKLDAPERVPELLRALSDIFDESATVLPTAWGDPNAGKVWHSFACILTRAAKSCDNAIARDV
jgi:hypothetical protein